MLNFLFLGYFLAQEFMMPVLDAIHSVFPEQNFHYVEEWRSWGELPSELLTGLKEKKNLRMARWEGEMKGFKIFDSSDNFVSWAVVTEELGEHQPITFMVTVNLTGEVTNVLILAYRESRGYGVKHPKFRKQFSGKTVRDPIAVRQDIVHVSGSTISSRSVSRGVRKVLALLSALGEKGL